MGTPASQVLADAGKGGAGGNAPPPGGNPAGVDGALPAGATASNDAFWNSWNDPADKDLRTFAQTKNWTDPKAAVKSYRELEGTVSTLRATANLKGYPAPTTKADGTVVPPDANAVAAWRVANGVPETADKYELPTIENDPFPEYGKGVKEIAHRLGMPPALMKAFAAEHEQLLKKVEVAARANEDALSKSALLSLEKEWGPKYQENLALAQRAREFFTKNVPGFTAEKERMVEGLLGTGPWLNFLQKIGAGNTEAGFGGGSNNGGGSAFGGKVAQAQARFDQLQAERSAGKLSNMEWAEINKKGGEMDSLISAIASGNAPVN